MDTQQRNRPNQPPRRNQPAGQGRPAPQGRPVPQGRPAPQRKTAAQSTAAKRSRPAQATRRSATKATPAPARKPRRSADPRNRSRRMQAAASQRRQAQARAKQGHKPRPKPDVVYTPPKPFSRDRLLWRLVTVAAVVIALMIGVSIFFRVENVVVYGADTYSAWTIREASGIQEGDALLGFGSIRASSKIKEALPYVDTVRIGIKLPDTVNIIIDELEVVYAIKSLDGTWWLITSSGRVVEMTNGATASGYTQITGVALDNPKVNEQAVGVDPDMDPNATTAPVDSTEGTEETTNPVTVTAQDRLDAALEIAGCLELNDIVGEAAKIDVSDLGNIELIWYGEQYQVKLGDMEQMDYKIATMKQAIAQLDEYQEGILDVSFRYWQNQVGYTPFD